ncbi:endonuclease III domain-containing protein [Limosilactobacillus sp.]|jgi:endonuclease-3 related protein|uniref:endonuclease III domain-containing protein n=1 Tax=Limosilactobacillus sp. TaxID=2773925 RepID=UPI0025B9E6DF|nr:deoxyribonuclease I [Limosilactobacillus sp.]MCH3922729.1 deoxyribonuclease I [Limosilactobacillus sp.]MCH3927412.1 deoxyribonuclease I [Limosilactobacillus sp.]
MQITLITLYQKMRRQMGPSGWWPADSKEEIIIGAILIQNTNWRNADQALALLRKETSLNPNQLLALTPDKLHDLVRPAGFYRNKSRALVSVFSWLQSRALVSVFSWLRQFDYDYPAIRQKYGKGLRTQLLKLHGIGPETADVLLTYVFEVPTFISDKYARTLFTCLGATGLTSYQQLANRVTLPADFTAAMAQDFHGLIDEFGKRYFHPLTKFDDSFLAGDQLRLK